MSAETLRMFSLIFFLPFLLPVTTRAEEIQIQSKCQGGSGLWSDPNTWSGKAVPLPTDNVTISARDTVVFDRDDTDKLSCKSLALDPGGSALVFQTKHGKRVMNVAGPIESYGAIKMDASTSKEDSMALYLVSETPEGRVIILLRNSSLLISGYRDLPENQRNILISSPPHPTTKAVMRCVIKGEARSMIDIQHASLMDILVSGTAIDNTGQKPNERLNLVGNLFTGYSTIVLTLCDTPVVAKNTFISPKDVLVGCAAIYLANCAHGEVRENTILGQYIYGIQISGEATAMGNSVEKCTSGIYWYSGLGMIKQNVMRECVNGLQFDRFSGSVEELMLDKNKTGVASSGTATQLTSVSVQNIPPKGVAMNLESSSITLLNCNIKPDQISLGPTAPASAWVAAMQFLVLKINGKLSEHANVELQTAHPEKPLPKGAVDFNIRNSPTMIHSNGLTPLPQSLSPLIVQTWNIGHNGKRNPSPEYTLTISEPPAKSGDKPRILKTMTLKPEDAWYRPKPNEPQPTMEVNLP